MGYFRIIFSLTLLIFQLSLTGCQYVDFAEESIKRNSFIKMSTILIGLQSTTNNSISPTVNITTTAPDPTDTNIPVNITFSESVSGFNVGDITVSNGTPGNFTGSGANYSATIYPSSNGEVTVEVAGNVAQDTSLDWNTASNQLSMTYYNIRPTVTITSAAPNPTNTNIPVTITFGESVTGFVVGDIIVSNGTATNFAGSGSSYTATISPSGQGTVMVQLPENVAQNTALNGNMASNHLVRTYDTQRPTVSITTTAPNPTSTNIPVAITFSESVTGFEVGDITVGNGTAGNFTGSGTNYSARIIPTNEGLVTVNVASGRARDAATNLNTASNQLNVTYTPVQAQPTIIDHTCTTITDIPLSAITQAKSQLHIIYGHTSHGQQLVEGMRNLDAFMTSKGYTADTFAINYEGTASNGELDCYDIPWKQLGWSEYGRDLGSMRLSSGTQQDGNYTAWIYTTRKYLGWTPAAGNNGSLLNHYATGTPNYNGSANVVIWSWCGQVSYAPDAEIQNYLDNMSQLEQDYPQVKFVYMTGHVDGTGLDGTLHARNEIIRTYCINNNKYLYDFEDIESYDPTGNYFGDKLVSTACNYDFDGDGILEEEDSESNGWPREPLNNDRNWALDWQAAHPGEWYECDLQYYHTQHLNDNLKAYAAWWLFARLSGWDGI